MSESKFSNGVLLGIIIGGAAVFLFATPTGRKIMKILSEEGVQGISDLIETELDERLDEYEQDEVIEKTSPKDDEPQVQVPEGNGNGHSVKNKRFFRRRSS